MKKIFLLVFCLLLLSCSNANNEDVKISDDVFLGIIVSPISDADDLSLPTFYEANFSKEGNGYYYYFDSDIGYVDVPIHEWNDGDFSYNIISENDILCVETNQEISKDENSNIINNSIYNYEIALLKSALGKDGFNLRVLSIYFDAENKKIYAQKDIPSLLLNKDNKGRVHYDINYEYFSDEGKVSANVRINLDFGTIDCPVAYQIREFDNKDMLIKITDYTTDLPDEFKTDPECEYLIFKTIFLKENGEQTIDYSLYNQDENNINAYYNFDSLAAGKRNIILSWN